MLSLLTALTLVASGLAAPISVVRRQEGFSKSFRDIAKPIFAPHYTYFGNKDTRTLSQAFDDLGMRAVTVSFASAPEGKCELVADLKPLEDSNNIKDFIAKGGAVTVSFGGNLNDKSVLARQHIQQACTNEDDLAKLIRESMDRFQTHNLDFDIEDNGLLSDNDATKRLAGALAKVKADVPDAFITYTLSTLATGMGGDQIKQIQAAKDANLDLDGVILMTMNMVGKGGDNVKTSQDAITGGAKQLADVFQISLEDATKKMGMLPAIGIDNNGNNIDLNGAKELAAFAEKNSLVVQSYWDFNRDFPGGEAGGAQDLTVSSSPDQKDASEFFRVMNEVLTEGDADAASKVADVAAAEAAPVPDAPEVAVGQKDSLPGVDAAAVDAGGVAADLFSGVIAGVTDIAAAGAPGLTDGAALI